MATVSYYTLDAEGMMKQANQMMELIEQKAYQDGLISDPEAFSKRYSIVLVKPGTFSRWFDRVFNNNDPKSARFVILENPKVDDDEDGEQAHD